MPNRIIKETIKSSPEIDELSWFEEVVFNRLIVTVDDYGCYDGRVIVLKNALFPTKDNVTKKAVEDAIEKLERVKLLERYEAEGKPYIHLTTWEEHQRIRNKHRKYPVPGIDGDSLTNDGQMSADCQLESEYEYESKSEKESTKKFAPPTLEEVEEYCRERNNHLDAKRFFDYFNEGDWKDSNGKKVKNWKQKIITWENYIPSKESETLPFYDPTNNPQISDIEISNLLKEMNRA